MARLVAGCMTGTSIDGLDCALVAIDGHGLAMRARVVRCTSRPLGSLASRLRSLADQQPMTAGDIATLSREFALLHTEALQDLIAADKVDLIAVHGQTVFHGPPVSWQLLNAAPIAYAMRVPVVFDLRAADLAAGGQGAPITPIADWVLLGCEGESRAIINLGGFCNVTLLSDDGPNRVRGFDVCACNQLLDATARRLLDMNFDDGGRVALTGKPHGDALDNLLGVLASQSRSARSLGTGDELVSWLERHRVVATGPDLAATACAAIAQTIVDAINREWPNPLSTLILAGGGVRNAALVRSLRACSSVRLERTDAYGVPADCREPACMAVLGALCEDRVPITLPQVTGVKAAPIAGAWVLP